MPLSCSSLQAASPTFSPPKKDSERVWHGPRFDKTVVVAIAHTHRKPFFPVRFSINHALCYRPATAIMGPTSQTLRSEAHRGITVTAEPVCKCSLLRSRRRRRHYQYCHILNRAASKKKDTSSPGSSRHHPLAKVGSHLPEPIGRFLEPLEKLLVI